MAGTSPMGRSDGTSGQKPGLTGVFSNPEYSKISSSVRCGTWLARSVPGKLGFRLSVKSRKQSSGSVLKSHRFSSSFGCALGSFVFVWEVSWTGLGTQLHTLKKGCCNVCSAVGLLRGSQEQSRWIKSIASKEALGISSHKFLGGIYQKGKQSVPGNIWSNESRWYSISPEKT